MSIAGPTPRPASPRPAAPSGAEAAGASLEVLLGLAAVSEALERCATRLRAAPGVCGAAVSVYVRPERHTPEGHIRVGESGGVRMSWICDAAFGSRTEARRADAPTLSLSVEAAWVKGAWALASCAFGFAGRYERALEGWPHQCVVAEPDLVAGLGAEAALVEAGLDAAVASFRVLVRQAGT